jgi:hypothetical protein
MDSYQFLWRQKLKIAPFLLEKFATLCFGIANRMVVLSSQVDTLKMMNQYF